jgi:hypothetical protein
MPYHRQVAAGFAAAAITTATGSVAMAGMTGVAAVTAASAFCVSSDLVSPDADLVLPAGLSPVADA